MSQLPPNGDSLLSAQVKGAPGPVGKAVGAAGLGEREPAHEVGLGAGGNTELHPGLRVFVRAGRRFEIGDGATEQLHGAPAVLQDGRDPQ